MSLESLMLLGTGTGTWFCSVAIVECISTQAKEDLKEIHTAAGGDKKGLSRVGAGVRPNKQ